jgi:GNAT superfamily N-acetyltransferase
MPRALIPDLQLVLQAQRIVAEYTGLRVQIVADRPGNPLRAEIRRVGAAVALKVPVFGAHLFNRAYGFSDAELDAAREIVDWYAQAGVIGSFEITPGRETTKLIELLQRHGYRHTGFHATFAGPAELPSTDSPGIEVRAVANQTDLAAFADVYHRGWNITEFRVPMAPWLVAPGWRLYLGLADGEPAGAAILYLSGGDAYLADGAVDPRYRGRGVHRALLDRRCADAAGSGAQLVVSGAAFLSASYRNMLRKGLRLLYTEAIWTVASS